MTDPAGPLARAAQAALDAVRAAAAVTPSDFALAPPAPQEPTVTDRTPAQTLTAAAELLRGAQFRGAMTATQSMAALVRARLPLADWLAEEASLLDDDDFPGMHERAFAVAREILGEASQ